MALTSTTTNDLVAGTSTLVINSGVTIENIVYTNSTNQLVFATQNAFTISNSDFFAFAKILDQFNISIQTVFRIPGLHVPLSISQMSQTNDGSGNMTFLFQKGGHPVYLIATAYPNGICSFSKRNQASILTFQEWLLYQAFSEIYEGELTSYA
jgi:hypothetical protein